ncbi:hypothetical protein SORBI_3007G049733 [Sorghum bicolor]|uniref:Uncharacterized protein n=1 Tax=Sorghum bicolor TaxID=4558 RepID=A0A1Z5R921_SORBI|nr:hypothetical protein SORBI_3007G049733 [Sorghum bicolor]
MSNMLMLDLFNSMRAGRSSSSYSDDDYEDDEYEYEELVPTMITIKPAYRWAIRVFSATSAIVVVIGNITAEEHIVLKIASVVIMILLVWFVFVESADTLVYKVKRVTGIPPESMV